MDQVNQDFSQLQITPREVEQLTGQDVSETFVGGVVGGIYRPTSLQRRRGMLSLVLIECVVAGLMFIFSLPIGLTLLRRSNAGGFRVLIISTGITIVLMFLWNIYMRWQLQSFKRLLPLLDEVDRFNQMLQTLIVINQFNQGSIIDRQTLYTTLELTRETLTTAMATERILRENRRLLEQQHSFLSHLERNLTTLRSLELSQQAAEYQQIVQEAMTINLMVQQEMQQL
jgi:hypothetical protein